MTMLTRRAAIVAGGGAVLAAAAVRFPGAAEFRSPRAPSAADVLAGKVKIAFDRASQHFYDPQRRAIRPTNGGSPFARNGLIDPGIANPALWQRESFGNVIFNEWQRTGDDRLRRELLDEWRAAQALYTPGQLIGLVGGAPPFRIVTTFDDACWLCTYLMHAHIAGAPEALGYLVEAIAYNLARFADPDTSRNAAIGYVAQTPNQPRIDFATGSIRPQGLSAPGQKMLASRFGSLYTLPETSSYRGGYGKCSSAFEAVMGLNALYVYSKLGYAWMLDYARHAQNFVKTCLLTPNPNAAPADPAHTPREPSARKAQYLVETEFCLSTDIPSNDPYPMAMRPRDQWFGKPVRSLDSTYLGGALAYCVLSSRLYRLGLGDDLRLDALRTAQSIISEQGYGRQVGGRTLIANTRDPHSEGHWAVEFAQEVLTLPGAPAPLRQAFVDTGLYMGEHCLTPDGYITADWAGPELNPVSKRTTWEQDYAALPGAQAGHVQIMTTAESLSMLQACAIAARTSSAT